MEQNFCFVYKHSYVTFLFITNFFIFVFSCDSRIRWREKSNISNKATQLDKKIHSKFCISELACIMCKRLGTCRNYMSWQVQTIKLRTHKKLFWLSCREIYRQRPGELVMKKNLKKSSQLKNSPLLVKGSLLSLSGLQHILCSPHTLFRAVISLKAHGLKY